MQFRQQQLQMFDLTLSRLQLLMRRNEFCVLRQDERSQGF